MPGMRAPTIVVAAFLGLHLVLAHWNPLCLWGADALAYHPQWVHAIFALFGALLLIPRTRRLALTGLAAVPSFLNPWRSRRSFWTFAALLVALALAAFVALRSAAHLLGDGLLLARELNAAAWQQVPRIDRAPLFFWFIESLHEIGSPIWSSAENTYVFCSCLGGLLYVLLSLLAARALGTDAASRTLVLGLLLTPGFIQLFFGYVENYALLLSGILLYLVLCLHTIRGPVPLIVPTALLGLLIPLHFAAATLAPSLLALAVLRPRPPAGSPGSAWWRPVASTLTQLAILPVVTLLVFRLVGFHPIDYLGELGGSHFLPLSGAARGSHHPYSLMTPAHLLDVFNQAILTAPAAVIAFLLYRRSSGPPDRDRTFLLAASLFPLIFIFAANPEIGAFRDWDVFAFAALPLTLWAATTLIGRMPDRGQLAHAGILICGAALLHSAAWVAVNARDVSAETRFAHLLDTARLTVHARSYGWETLGSHYRRKAEPDSARRAYGQAIEADPDHPRHWSSVGSLWSDAGKHDRAIGYLQRAIELKPDFPRALYNLGNAHFGLHEYEKAAEHYKRAIALDPSFARAHLNLGSAYHKLGNQELAIDSYGRAAAIAPESAEIYYNMGIAYHRLGQPLVALELFDTAIGLDPTLPKAHFNAGTVCMGLRDYEAAARHLERAVALDPRAESAHYNLGTAYVGLGRKEEARKRFGRVLELSPEFPHAAAIRRWLETNP